jgi:hypothetical protein
LLKEIFCVKGEKCLLFRRLGAGKRRQLEYSGVAIWEFAMHRGAVSLLILSLLLPVQALGDDALGAAANQAFIAGNAGQQGVVTRPSGLQYRILRSGFGKRPGATDVVRITYSGHLINGKVFDGTSPGLPATLAVNGVIRGLNEALQLMHEGDRWQVVIPADLGFGTASAAGGAVPPNQTLVFDITLMSTTPAQAAPAPDSGSPLSLSASSAGRETQEKAFLTFRP